MGAGSGRRQHTGRLLRGAVVLTAVSAASLSWLFAITEAGWAVQGAPHARTLAAVLAVGGAIALWAAVWAAAGRNPFGRWRPNALLPDRAPRRLLAARIALSIASIMTLLMASALPFPYRTREQLVAFLALASVAIAGIIAAVLITRRAPYGRALTVALGVYGLAMAIWRLPHMLPVIGPDAGPGAVVLALVVVTVWASHVIAAACVLSLRGAWPQNKVGVQRVLSSDAAR